MHTFRTPDDELPVAAHRVAVPRSAGFSLGIERSIEDFIDRHLHSTFRIGTIADTFGYSLSRFYATFRRSFGMSPHDYVTRRRVLLASRLLLTTDLPIVDIAVQAGFSDQAHLTRRFREWSGTPPHAFRRQHRSASLAR